jgi:hypothetical protein
MLYKRKTTSRTWVAIIILSAGRNYVPRRASLFTKGAFLGISGLQPINVFSALPSGTTFDVLFYQPGERMLIPEAAA